MTVTFSEPVRAASVVEYANVILQQTAVPGVTYTVLTATHSVVNGLVVSVYLSVVDMNAVKLNNTLFTGPANSFLTLLPGFVTDMNANALGTKREGRGEKREERREEERKREERKREERKREERREKRGREKRGREKRGRASGEEGGEGSVHRNRIGYDTAVNRFTLADYLFDRVVFIMVSYSLYRWYHMVSYSLYK